MGSRFLKYPYLAALLICSYTSAIAARPSYLYIQGDKILPFYVKVNDKMMPRYGKDYCIIPNLAPGINHIEILFEQNKLPPEKFDITMPENGYRGFLLNKRNNEYELIDLHTSIHINAH